MTARAELDTSRTVLGGAWWRSAVIYQIYPRSFADADGDGVGDLRGILERMQELVELGIDAIWLSPFMTSPQRDGGYDVSDYCEVDPLFGTLEDFDELVAAAHRAGIRVIIDIVPNHTSSEHRWFRDAVAAAPGSPERERYIMRPGRGSSGELPPNNWQSSFGGAAWSRLPDGEWFMHMFDSSQPDLNWRDLAVRREFRDILRFWLRRGVDGFRVDVAHGMIKADGLPDYHPEKLLPFVGRDPSIRLAKEGPNPPYMMQEEVHDIWREWRAVVAEFGPDRILCAEAWVEPLDYLANWVRPDEMHQAFNFSYLETPWDAGEIRSVIERSLAAFAAVGAPSTWVLSNHDVIRHATRLALPRGSVPGDGLGPRSEVMIDHARGLRRARAASLLTLALPGSVYLYQGEELGLPEVVDLDDGHRRDPTWFRTQGARYGRDGCRVPIPWEAAAAAAGFSATGKSWLPQPEGWETLSRDAQRGDPRSTLRLYISALATRRERGLGDAELVWLEGYPNEVVAVGVGPIVVLANTGDAPVGLPPLRVIESSIDIPPGILPPDATVWLAVEDR